MSIYLKRLAIFFMLIFIIIMSISGCATTLDTAISSARQQGNLSTFDGESKLTVYFIDVGQADSALVLCDDKAMLIDGGNSADSDLIYSFLKNHEVEYLDYIVATHAHEDHVGGLAGALNYAKVGIALCPVTEHESKAFNNFIKYLDKQNVSITVPNHGDTFLLGGADVKIVGPIKPSNETNNTSIVLKITYGETSFLFTGDAERNEEQDILEEGYDLSSTVLKVGHHGSNTATSYPFLREILPKYSVISCGTGNSYGHPHENTLSRLRDADTIVYRTDIQGTIICTSDGKTISFVTERNANAQTNPTESYNDDSIFIGNINSHKFHRPGCSGLPSEKNSIILESWEIAINEGYEPCGKCIQ